MSGTFSKANRPTMAGSYFNFDATAVADPVAVGVGSTVALGITHDWGPENQVVAVDTFAEFQSVYGTTATTKGYGAARQAFLGEGLPGYGGAGRVLVYRMVGSAGAKATISLQNTTPAAALTLTARYKGSRGNALRVTTQVNVADGTKRDLILLDGTTEVERYTYLSTDITALVALINAGSGWITATQVITGVALSNVTAQAFTTGNDGSTLIAGDYTAAFAAFEPERFGVLAFEDLTDGPITTSLLTWAQNQNALGRRFMSVTGGPAAESRAAALARGTALNDPNFVTFGMGTITDSVLGSGLSLARLAPRFAGIIAQRGETKSMTFARLAGVTLVNGPTLDDIAALYAGGVCSLSRDDLVASPVRIERGVTTYTTTTNTAKPYAIFRHPHFVRVMQGLEVALCQWADQNVIGKVTVNAASRKFVLGEAKRRLAESERLGAIQSGWTVEIDPDPPASDNDDFIALLIGLHFGRSAERVFFTARVA